MEIHVVVTILILWNLSRIRLLGFEDSSTKGSKKRQTHLPFNVLQIFLARICLFETKVAAIQQNDGDQLQWSLFDKTALCKPASWYVTEDMDQRG